VNVINLPSEDETLGPLALDHIYVTEAVPVQALNASPTPDSLAEKSWDKLALSGLSLAAFAMMRTTPIGLIASAVGAAAVSPFFVQLISRDSVANVEEQKQLNEAQTLEAARFAAYMRKHSVTPAQAEKAGFRFEPGHPLVGKVYKRHPLAGAATHDKHHLYIPSERYDQILLAEREAELIKMLVDMGATRIQISKKSSEVAHSSSDGSASADISGYGGCSASYSSKNDQTRNAMDSREFRLRGKQWNEGDRLARADYLWLAFEPSWAAVVMAREIGACEVASLEIKETTSFSNDRNIEFQIQAQMLQAGANAQITASAKEETEYFIRVEFAPAKEPRNQNT
jgi:hypothetical protein